MSADQVVLLTLRYGGSWAMFPRPTFLVWVLLMENFPSFKNIKLYIFHKPPWEWQVFPLEICPVEEECSFLFYPGNLPATGGYAAPSTSTRQVCPPAWVRVEHLCPPNNNWEPIRIKICPCITESHREKQQIGHFSHR